MAGLRLLFNHRSPSGMNFVRKLSKPALMSCIYRWAIALLRKRILLVAIVDNAAPTVVILATISKSLAVLTEALSLICRLCPQRSGVGCRPAWAMLLRVFSNRWAS